MVVIVEDWAVVVGVSEKTIRKIVHTIAVEADVAKKLPNSWMYSVRTHSLRKYFRTQMSAAKIDSEIIQYMMGPHNRHIRRRPELRHRNPQKPVHISKPNNQTQNTDKQNRTAQRNHTRLGTKPRTTTRQRSTS